GKRHHVQHSIRDHRRRGAPKPDLAIPMDHQGLAKITHPARRPSPQRTSDHVVADSRRETVLDVLKPHQIPPSPGFEQHDDPVAPRCRQQEFGPPLSPRLPHLGPIGVPDQRHEDRRANPAPAEDDGAVHPLQGGGAGLTGGLRFHPPKPYSRLVIRSAMIPIERRFAAPNSRIRVFSVRSLNTNTSYANEPRNNAPTPMAAGRKTFNGLK